MIVIPAEAGILLSCLFSGIADSGGMKSFVTALVILMSPVARASAVERVPVTVITGGDDGLTQRLADEVRKELLDWPQFDFRPNAEDALQIAIPEHVDWRNVGGKTRVNYKLQTLGPNGAGPLAGGECWETQLQVCAVQLIRSVIDTFPHSSCHLRLGPMVSDVGSARRIAESVLASKQTMKQRSRYVLHVQEDSDDPSRWVAFQGLPPPPQRKGFITVQAGGGGYEMHIDKCTGEITRVHLER